MPKEKFKENSFNLRSYTTETQKFALRSFAEASEDQRTLYAWFEEHLITGEAKLEIKKHIEGDSELETALITTVDPETKKKVEYYTTEPYEIERLKAVRDGKPLVEKVTADSSNTAHNDDLE